MNLLQELVDRHRRYHQLEPQMLRYAAMAGLVGYPLFYLLRRTQSSPGYDDWPLSVTAMLACLLILLRDRWPRQFQPHFHLVAWIVPIFCLPFLFVFTSLKNGGGADAVANTLMATFFIVLLTDRRNMLVMLAIGFASAFAAFWVTEPHPEVPLDYAARLPVLLMVVAGGAFFKHGVERAVAIKVRQAYASLANSIAHEMRHPLRQLEHSLSAMQLALPAPITGTHSKMLTSEELNRLYELIAQSELAVQRSLQVTAMALDEVHDRSLSAGTFSLLMAGEACARAIEEYDYEDAAQRNQVSLRVDCDFVFRADKTAFLFAMYNLIKSALANPGVRVQIVVDAGQVDVRNDGPGMSPEVQARLYQPFRGRGKAHGTGLGLAYCWRVMKAFGGTIACLSMPGRSTTFRLNLPVATVAERELERAAMLSRARALFDGRRLLVVDADAAVRLLTRYKIASIGAVVDECADGAQALLMLAQERYDLIVLDLKLPGLDGYALARRIRAGQLAIDPRMCIVACSNEPAVVAWIKTRKADMDGHVAWPCEQVALLATLCDAMENTLAREAELQAPSLEGRSMLLADDNACLRRAVAASLRAAGVAVVEAENGLQVMSRLATMDRCDVILLDVEMPGMNGFDAARAIRASTLACRSAPILMLTAHSAQGVVEEAKRAGVNGFLTKPFDMATLQASLLALPLDNPPQVRCDVTTGLLDISRLDNYRRLGVLDELVVDYLPAIERLLVKVESAAEAHDRNACCDALHSLVGMGGEAGAQALQRFARHCYVPLLEEGRWPEKADWTDALRTLADRSRRAMIEYAAPAEVDKA